MASIANDQDPEQQTNQAPAQTPAAGAPVAVSGTAGASASGGQGASGSNGVGGAAPSSPVAANTAPQSSAGYVDVGSYLDANQGGSQQLGNSVATNLTNDYNATTSGIDSSAQNAQSLADQGYTHENSGLIQQAASDPVGTVSNPANVSAVQAQLNDTYSGPTNWADLGTQQGNVANAQQEGSLTTTPGGLNVLAQQVEGDNTSQGINQLDTLLLGGSPTAMNTVQAAADPFATLGTYLDNANTGVTNAITTGQNNAAQTATDANAALLGPNGATTNITNQVNAEMQAAQQSAAQQNATVKAALAGLNPTAADLTTLGLSQPQWDSLKAEIQNAAATHTATSNTGAFTGQSTGVSVDPTQWLTQQNPNTAITAQNVATPQQYAQEQALQQLVGPNNYTSNLTDPTQAGTAPTNLNAFNYTGANTATGNTVAAEQKAAQAYADALQSGADAAAAQAAAQKAAQVAEGYEGVGAALGTYAGGALGSVLGPVGTAGGAALGSVIGGIGGEATNLFNNDIKNGKVGSTLVNLATGGIPDTIQAITNIFCFHPDTPITMHDGQTLPISQVEVGDFTKGGRVLSTSRSVGQDFYMYNGVLVTAMHAVREGGRWVRIKDAQESIKCPPFTEVVCNLVTEMHRIYANGIEFADEHETDEYESLNLDQSLQRLNYIDARR